MNKLSQIMILDHKKQYMFILKRVYNMNISICIDALFNGKDFVESMKSVKTVGVKTIEFWCWWDKDIRTIKLVKDELNFEIADFCTKFVSLTDSSKRGKYMNGLKESVEIAKYLGSKKLLTQTGNDNGNPREIHHNSIIEGLHVCLFWRMQV